MGSLESALRDTFAAQVRTQPALEDVAGRAVVSAGRIRLRRRVLGAAAIAVSVALVSAGVAVFGERGRAADPDRLAGPTAVPDLSHTLAAPPVDLLVGREIRRTDGTVVALALVPNPNRAWRTSDGWLVESVETLGTGLWFVDLAGKQTAMVSGEKVAVAPDGVRIAWSRAGRVSVADRVGTALTRTAETGGTGGLGPIGFAAGGVVLGGTGAGGADTYDMWFPAKGAYAVGPRGFDRILAANAAGTRLFGVTGPDCLAEIDPDGLRVLRSACGLGLTIGTHAYPSPDGRWVALVDADGMSLYDLRTVWTRPGATASYPTHATNAAWLDATSLVFCSRMTVQLIGPGPEGPIRAVGLISTSDLTQVRYTLASAEDRDPVAVIPRLG